MKPTIKTTWPEIKHHMGRLGIDFISVEHLGKYGFTDQIINDMVTFDIFPQLYKVCGAIYVLREDIFGSVVRKLLENSMAVYKHVQDLDEARAKIKEVMEDVIMDEEAVAKLASGEWTMDQVRERSQALLAERAATNEAEVTA